MCVLRLRRRSTAQWRGDEEIILESTMLFPDISPCRSKRVDQCERFDYRAETPTPGTNGYGQVPKPTSHLSGILIRLFSASDTHWPAWFSLLSRLLHRHAAEIAKTLAIRIAATQHNNIRRAAHAFRRIFRSEDPTSHAALPSTM